RGTKGIDRLGIVADHGEPCAIGRQREKDRGLQSVRVLILVNQDVVEIRPHLRGDAGHLYGLVPIQQQIVVIEHVVTLFGGDISGKEAFQLGFPLVAPGEGVGQRLLKRTAGIDAVGIDRQTRALLWEPGAGAGEAEIAADQVHQIGAIGAVEHGEGWIQREGGGAPAPQPAADRMKVARPGQKRGLGTAGCSTTLARNEDLLRAAGHFERGAAGKGQQQQTTRTSASEGQPRHPVRQRLGFAGAGPRSDQQRRRPLLCLDTIGSSAALRRVQPLEKHVYGPRGTGSVLFLFHRNRTTSSVRPRNPARSRQTKASVPAITDRGYGRSAARIGGCAKRSSARSIACTMSGRYDELQLMREREIWSFPPPALATGSVPRSRSMSVAFRAKSMCSISARATRRPLTT